MTPAENHIYWLGFEVAAKEALGGNAGAAALAQLLQASPEYVRAFRPSGWRTSKYRRARLENGEARVMVCRLREALTDIGFDGAVETLPGEGYRIPQATAKRIKSFVEKGFA